MEKKFTILDVENDIYLETFNYQSAYSAGGGKSAPIRILKRRLRGGTRDGVDVIEIDSGRLSFEVVLTRGMNVLKAKCDDVELKWDSPVKGPVHPCFVPLFAPNGCGWLEGFCEWIARCGLESNGAPEFDSHGVLKNPLHGRLSNLPACKVELSVNDETGMIKLSGDVVETSVFGRRFLLRATYAVQAGSTKLWINDRITNLASVDDEFELLYHINTGYPLVTPSSRFYAAFEKMCPRDANAASELESWDICGEPIPGIPETCYFFDLAANPEGKTDVVATSKSQNRGLRLSFSKKEFPYFILWKTRRPNGDIYVAGMEPAVNFPNTRSFEKEHGRVVPIAANETKTFSFTLDVLTDSERVDDAIKTIRLRQEQAKGEVIAAPIKEWCE